MLGLVITLSLFTAAALLTAYLLPDKALLKAQKALRVRDEAAENRHLLLKYTKWLYRPLSPYAGTLKVEKYRAKSERRLIKADIRDIIDVSDFMALKASTCLIGFALQIGDGLLSVEGLDLVSILKWALGGFFIPDLWLYLMTKKRERILVRELPFFIDLLTLSVEAGLDFIAAITRITEKQKDSLLCQEFGKVLKEIKLGTSRSDALKHLVQRVQINEISSFLSVLIQASQMGISIGGVLRIQSDLIREQRFQKAEKLGAQATQKMLFPLIFLVLPVVVIVLFGPVILDMVYGK